MAIAYHGTAALFSQFDPSHLLEGDGKFKFGVGAYLSAMKLRPCMRARQVAR